MHSIYEAERLARALALAFEAWERTTPETRAANAASRRFDKALTEHDAWVAAMSPAEHNAWVACVA